MIELISPQNGAVVTNLTAEQTSFLCGGSNRRDYDKDGSRPLPIYFKFSPPLNGSIYVTDSKGNTSIYPATGGVAAVYNLLADESYEWYVHSGAMRSASQSFKTADILPRLVFVEGLSNVRDIGGYVTTDGGKVRQGLLYRSSEGDTHEQITASGITRLTKELKIKTDIDLRGVNGEPVGPFLPKESVRYESFPLAAYQEIFTPEQKALYKRSFELLAKGSTYPALVHCAAGMDRAGTFLFILGALIGIDEGDLVEDYELSSLSHWGARRRDSEDFSVFLERFHTYGGSARIAAQAFLSDCGVSDEDLRTIKKLFVEYP